MTSKSTAYKRKKRAEKLGVAIEDLPDMRGKHGKQPKGSSHPRWKNKPTTSHGYIRIRVGKNHPLSDPNGYTYEHVLVWESSGRTRPQGTVLHHINGDKTDNRIENLELMKRGFHNKTHNKERGRNNFGQFLPRK